MKNKKIEEKEKYIGIGIALGVAAGSVIGVLTDNAGLWIALGIVFGSAIGIEMSNRKK